MMKIAFLMQCHKNPEQINLLLKALKHPQVDVYDHVVNLRMFQRFQQ